MWEGESGGDGGGGRKLQYAEGTCVSLGDTTEHGKNIPEEIFIATTVPLLIHPLRFFPAHFERFIRRAFLKVRLETVAQSPRKPSFGILFLLFFMKHFQQISVKNITMQAIAVSHWSSLF